MKIYQPLVVSILLSIPILLLAGEKQEVIIPFNSFPSSNMYEYKESTLQVSSSSKQFSDNEISILEKKISSKIRQVKYDSSWKLILKYGYDKKKHEIRKKLNLSKIILKIDSAFVVDLYVLKANTNLPIVSIPGKTKTIRIQIHAKEKPLIKETYDKLQSNEKLEIIYELDNNDLGSPHKYLLKGDIKDVIDLNDKLLFLTKERRKSYMLVFYDKNGNRIKNNAAA